jgi:hypothetical protein
LVGRATTDTLTNKTLTGAAMNGTVGATTPATGAFTTLSATGNFTFGGNLNSSLTSEFYIQSPNGNNFIGINQTSSYVRVATAGQVVLNLSNTVATFNLGGTEKMSLTTTGLKTASTISVGDATPSTSGAGITFPATQSASSNANTLDDYEEGSWTYDFTATTGTITKSATYLTGLYTKTGRQVTVTGFLAVSSVSSPTGTLTVTGLPYPVTSVSDRAGFAGGGIYGSLLAVGSVSPLMVSATSGNTSLTIAKFVAGSAADLAGDVVADTRFHISFSYFTD